MVIIERIKNSLFLAKYLKGGDLTMKKVLTLILSVMLLVSFTFLVGCPKPAEEPPPAPAPAPAPEPAPAPAPEPAPAPAPAYPAR